MAVPDGMTKLVISGTMAGGEKFAFSLWLEGFTEPPLTGSIDLAATVAESTFVAFLNAVKAVMSTGTIITQVDAYWYTGNEAVAHLTQILATPIVGAGSAPTPNQIAAVMTLRTALATRSGRGRVYIPATGAGTVAATGLFGSAGINGVVDALAAWMSHYSISDPPITPVVVSQTHGFVTPIVSVDADLVPDTQRRRRNKMSSARHVHAVTPH